MFGETCSLAVIGDGAVGKSTIIAAFCRDGFTPVYKQTVGCEFYEKNLNIQGDKYVSLRVWDIGGQSINSKSLEQYLSNSNIFFLVYDVTNPESFANIEDWLMMVRKFSKSQFIYLIGNKVDLIQHRQITKESHYLYVTQNSLKDGVFLSAKTGENVVRVFYQAAAEAVGVKLGASELAMYDKVLTAHVSKAKDEGRTAFADDIEREDEEAEKRKQAIEERDKQNSGCNCTLS